MEAGTTHRLRLWLSIQESPPDSIPLDELGYELYRKINIKYFLLITRVVKCWNNESDILSINLINIESNRFDNPILTEYNI